MKPPGQNAFDPVNLGGYVPGRYPGYLDDRVLALSILYLPMNIFGLAIGLFVAQGGMLLSLFHQGMKVESR